MDMHENETSLILESVIVWKVWNIFVCVYSASLQGGYHINIWILKCKVKSNTYSMLHENVVGSGGLELDSLTKVPRLYSKWKKGDLIKSV